MSALVTEYLKQQKEQGFHTIYFDTPETPHSLQILAAHHPEPLNPAKNPTLSSTPLS